MPPFKRVKRNPSAAQSPDIIPGESDSSSILSTPKSSQPVSNGQVSPAVEEQGAVDAKDQQPKTLNARQSWYGGTWPHTPKKAAPITQLATDNISASSEATAKTTGRAKSIAGSVKGSSRPPSVYMSPGASSRSLPATVSTSKINVSTPKVGITSSQEAMDVDTPEPTPKESDQSKNATKTDSEQKQITGSSAPGRSETPSSWRGWIPGFRPADDVAAKDFPENAMKGDSTPQKVPSTNISVQPGSELGDTAMSGIEVTSDPNINANIAPAQTLTSRPRSWFGLWNGDSSTKGAFTNESKERDANSAAGDFSNVSDQIVTEDNKSTSKNQGQEGDMEAPSEANLEPQPKQIGQNSAATGWSFWSRGSHSADLKEVQTHNEDQAQDSENHDEIEPRPKVSVDAESPKATSSSRKRERPSSVEVPLGTQEDKISRQAPDGKTSATAAIDVLPAGPDDKVPPRRQQSTNLLLPSLKQTLRAAENPGLLSRLAGYIYASRPPPAKHVNLIKDPTKVKHALAIGVHGYFPAPFLRTVIGQPRGTSIRFATNAAEAIANWSRNRGCSPKIDKIALEGEGKIEERVDLLWQLLLKHIDKVREADFILIACHSQGVPVAVQLVAKLIGFGCMSSARVGICAMAGVNQGPFAEYKSRWIGGSAGELFDFASPSSKVSMDYEVALNTVLKSGVKIVLVGSIDDQLVSMESATFGNAEHPCIFRAVFINSQVHAPTFLVHLVGFALKLRNLGIPDHGLIRELSNSLSGSFTGDGHSRLYEDLQLYDTAIEFALETTQYPDVPLAVRKSPSTASQNPYILPFAMRGVLEEDFVRSELHSEMLELLKQFDDWKPVTKPLKDVKFRLEGVRSKI